MFRLTREVRFAINSADDRTPDRPPTNSYAGYPSLSGLGHYFTLAVTLAGDLHPQSHYLENIKQIDQVVRRLAIPLFDRTIRQHPDRFGAPLLAETFDLHKTLEPNDGPAQIVRWDSLGTLRLLLALEDEFGLHLPENALYGVTSVSAVIDVIEQAT